MAIQQKIDLTQSQQLVMTPQLQQAIKLLQFSSQELNSYIEQRLQENPILEREEEKSWQDSVSDDYQDDDDGEDYPVQEDSADYLSSDILQDNAAIDLDDSNEYDRDYTGTGDILHGEYDSGMSALNVKDSKGNTDFSDNNFDPFAHISEKKSLRKHIEEQIRLDIVGEQERFIAYALLDLLDPSGWINPQYANLHEQLGVEEGAVENILKRLQKMDPAGIFARNLSECLAAQLLDRGELSAKMQILLDNLHLLASREMRKLLRLLQASEEEVLQMMQIIKSLNPKPGADFDIADAQIITPDLFFSRDKKGRWFLELNNSQLPKISLNTQYYKDVTENNRLAKSKGKAGAKDKNYINEQYSDAKWLLKSLKQRSNTILKVGSEIVKQQRRFFDYGIQNLRPLVLRDVAEAIDMHESTVSRVTNNKYIASPRGIFELKYFFTAALHSASGHSTISAESVRYIVKDLIKKENPKKILSDDAIVNILTDRGIDIARRTVAKYREALGIPSSVQRRKEKNSGF